MTAHEYSLSRVRAAPRYPHPGGSTAVGSNVSYRLGKLKDLGLLQGVSTAAVPTAATPNPWSPGVP